MVLSDNVILFFIAWILSNVILVKLMIHKPSWRSAFCSGMLASKNFILGAIFLALGLAALYYDTEKLSIKAIANCNISPLSLLASQIFLLLAAMTQSAIWPFHRWLISSLNSPTPVSSIMHAGLINGGGFLIVRFSFLYINSPKILTLIFIIGLMTACIGTIWKLMQHDIKRMLACSTMGQMGFMLAQCGLGLFSAAIIHLCLHGLFKAYLFLGSGSTAQEKRIDLKYPPKWGSFFFALLGGLIGCYSFALASGKAWNVYDTNLIILLLVWILCCQFTLSFLLEKSPKNIINIFMIIFLLSGIYGLMIRFLDGLLDDLNLVHPQPLNIIHFLGMGVLFFCWFGLFFVKHLNTQKKVPTWILYLYVKLLNGSQPDFTTITNNRNAYTYLK
ncbi:MAG: proton-conducting transporter membrane subunit [Candidatus Dependentiae bacterium]|nr:proton-conducting transporter membrane subunit [Candidatus Dependentiae bacterium]